MGYSERESLLLTYWKSLGPIVRISPSEVSIAHVSVAKQVYKVGGPFRSCDSYQEAAPGHMLMVSNIPVKTKWYDQFTGRGVRSIFQVRDPYDHSQLRKLASAHFSEKYVATLEPAIIKNVRLAVLRMEEEVRSQGYCDVFKWFTFMV